MSAVGTCKYDMRYNPVYQVDCQIEASGKLVATSKRRIRWRFGFSNKDALSSGLNGTDCRGEEHEVVLVWSLTSGKQLVLADGVEVHFASARLSDKFEKSWTMKGGHHLKVIAYAAPPLFTEKGFRQFDFLIDGLSFWDMPRIYELGKGGRSRTTRPRTSPVYRNYELPPAEAHYGRSSQSQYSTASEPHFCTPTESHFSRPPSDRHASMPLPPQNGTHQQGAPLRRSNSFSAPAPTVDLMSEPTKVEDYLLPSPTSVVDEFTPVAPMLTQAPHSSYQDKANEILSTYMPTATPHVSYPALANESHTNYAQPSQYAQPNQFAEHNQYAQQPTVNTSYAPAPQHHPVVTPDASYAPYHGFRESPVSVAAYGASPEKTPGAQVQAPVQSQSPPNGLCPSMMKPLDIDDLYQETEKEVSPMEKAIKNLVNFDNIAETKATPQQKKDKERKEANRPISSKPVPPTRPEWHIGKNASLAEIKKHAPQKEAKADIMRTHAFDPAAASAGMMVLYGATNHVPQQQYGGIHGGIPAPCGFGAGSYMQRNVYACQ